MAQQQSFSDEIDLREYLRIIKKRWKVIAAITISLAVLSLMFSLTRKPTYEARTTILLRSESSSVDLGGLAGLFRRGVFGGNQNQNDLMELLKSKAVAAKVFDDLQLDKGSRAGTGPGSNGKN